MKKIIDSIREYYLSEEKESLRRKLTSVILPAIIFMGIVSMVLTYTLDMGAIPMIQAVSASVVPVAIVGIGFSQKDYDRCFTAICIFLTSVLLPSAVLTTGGLQAGMPVLCAASLVLCGLCAKPIMRFVSFVAAVAANILVDVICIVRPEWVFPIEASILDLHICLCMAVAGSVLFLLGTMFISIYEFNHRMQDALLKHMDENVCRTLTDKSYDVTSRERCNTAVMFADICNFTSLSESMDTETVAEFLNTYFEIAYKAIHDNGGVVDKYIGDCVMAFWKDGDAVGDAAVKACRAAMDIKHELKERCVEIVDRFGCELEFTAGINYGIAYVGDIGCEERKDYTVIGDTVNLAARIQAIAPKGEVYLSDAMARIVLDDVYLVRVPKKVPVKGKSDPIDIFTLVSMEKPKDNTVVVDEHESSGYIFHICGSRGSYAISGKRYLEFGGETSCYLFKKDHYALVVDCGSGLQRARELLADCTDIDVIFTHLHYDHVIGLLDFMIFPKNANLKFYGNFDEWLGDVSLKRIFDAPYWPVNLFRGEQISVRTEKDYQIQSDIRVRFYPASHPNHANLVVIYLKGRRVCVMADCENPDDLPFEILDHCDIILYDGMYEDKYYSEHIGWGHSTWESGVRLAQKVNPKRLLITHHNPRNSDEKLRGLEIEAQEIFPATIFVKAGDRFVL